MATLGGVLLRQLKHAWNAFTNLNLENNKQSMATNFGYNRPDRVRLTYGNERSILASIITRLSMDAAGIDVRHVRLDDQKRYVDDIDSGLNNCLTLEANIDQAATQFRQDVFLTMFDKGVAALVPIDTTLNPAVSSSYDIKTMRVGEVTAWRARQVRVNVYNEKVGYRQEITLGKDFVAIVENPLRAVMNEPNSTLQRLICTLNQLDAINTQSASGKLDLIIQLPYVIKSDTRRTAAENRRADLESQLQGSKYGVAYIDGTERVVQLNRPAENNLLSQVDYLTKLLYSQLGLTEDVMNGTADEATMLNYYTRTIEPLLEALVQAMRRTFLTKTGRSQGQWILYFRDPFKFVTIANLADVADKLRRNQVASPNDIRVAIGWRPSKEKGADALANTNMPASPPGQPGPDLPNPGQPIRVPAMAGRRQLTAAPSGPLIESRGGNSQNGSRSR
jgi:hypothetical protein